MPLDPRAPRLPQGREDKLQAQGELLGQINLNYDQAAYPGDDLPDLPVIRRAGLGVAVVHAASLVGEHTHDATQARGGEGAAREFCELLLRAQGRLDAAHAAYL